MGCIMDQKEKKLLKKLRKILKTKKEALVILNNYFKGGVGKSKLSTMFTYISNKLGLKVLIIDEDLQATLTKDHPLAHARGRDDPRTAPGAARTRLATGTQPA